MNHYKKLGYTVPKDYFIKSKKEILNKTNSNTLDRRFEFSYFKYSLAAIFIGLLLYNLIDITPKSNEINSDSPLLSSIVSGEEITDEFIIEYYSESIVLNEFQIPK
ncbi:MAG: hypothetical protein VW371_01160 [Bacteroidota bacterium]